MELVACFYRENKFSNLLNYADVLKVLKDGDLQTLGMLDYDKRLNHPFTAHPKIDPYTGKTHILKIILSAKFSHRKRMIHKISAYRRDVYIWLYTNSSICHLPSYIEGWFHAWPSTYNNVCPHHDARLCHHWELCNFPGSSHVFQTKGLLDFLILALLFFTW